MSTSTSTSVDRIPGLTRVESTAPEDMINECLAMTRPAYPHEQVYGRFCTLEEYVDCPPEQVYDYLRQGHHLEEWTFSVRNFEPAGKPGLWVGDDRLEEGTRIFCRVAANPDAMTVDYHCAWDQSDQLWMVYLMRVVPAMLVLNRPGSVVTWTNCRHPNYDANPYPQSAPRPDRPWIGEFWDLFHAGHLVEMRNLKTILEHRHRNGEPVSHPPLRAVPR